MTEDKQDEFKRSDPDNRIRAIITVSITGPIGCGVSIAFKMAATHGVKPTEYQIFRACFMFIMMIPYLIIIQKHPWRDIPDKKLHLILLRAIFGTSAFILWMQALLFSPLSLNMVLMNLCPFWASFLAYGIYAERIYPAEIIAMFVCLGSVAGIAFLKPAGITTESVTDQTYDMVWVGLLIVFASSWISAGTKIVSRLGKGVHWSLFMFYYGIIGSVVPLIGVLISSAITNEPIFSYTSYPKALGWLLFGSVCDMICIICGIIAYQSDTTGFVSLLNYTAILWGFLADFTLFKQSFTVGQLLCALCILVTCVIITAHKLK